MLLVALPQVASDLRVGPSQVSWLVTGYLVAMAATLAIGGSLGDRYGRRRVILIGLAAFGLASTVGAVAPNLLIAIMARVLQAVASAVVFPSGAALLRELVAGHRRGRAFGTVGAALNLAAAAGPLAGSGLVLLHGWRLIFLINLPIVMVAFLLTARSIPRQPTEAGPAGSALDYGGMALLTATLIAISAALSFGARLGFGALALLAAVGGLAVSLVIYEARRPHPALRIDFFRVPSFAAASAGVSLSNFAMYSTLIALPVMMAARPGWNATGSGILLASMSTGSVLLSPVGGRLADRLGRRLPAVAGLSLAAMALLLVAVTNRTLVELAPLLAIAGCGFGLSSAGLQTTAVEAVAATDAGAAAGLYSTSRYLGSLVGSSLLAAVFAATNPGLALGPVMVMVSLGALMAAGVAVRLPGRPAPAAR